MRSVGRQSKASGACLLPDHCLLLTRMPNSIPEASPSIQAQPWAVRLGSALLAAFVVILGFAFYDNAHRQQLETISEATAVGDTHFFQPPADPSRVPAVGATLNGQPLYVTELQSIEVRDTHTRRAGRDSERGLAIYELSDAATDVERKRMTGSGRKFLLKTELNRYLAVRPEHGK